MSLCYQTLPAPGVEGLHFSAFHYYVEGVRRFAASGFYSAYLHATGTFHTPMCTLCFDNEANFAHTVLYPESRSRRS